MVREYILSFSSFYKAAYAKDVLEQQGIGSALRRLPSELAHSCNTGVYLRTDAIQTVCRILGEKEISFLSVYAIGQDREQRTVYQRI